MITILLFAQLQEAIGEKKLLFKNEGYTIRQLKKIIQQQYPAVELNHVMCAINEEYSSDEVMVKDGDVIAFIPPVSGG
ncbi:MAG: molybdopterin converting factor subunit 1 [Bacillus sp. (in: firmicutes)]